MSHRFLAGLYTFEYPALISSNYPPLNSISFVCEQAVFCDANTFGFLLGCEDMWNEMRRHRLVQSFCNTLRTLLWLTSVTLATFLSVLRCLVLITVSIRAITDGVHAILGRLSLLSSAPPLAFLRSVRSSRTASIGSVFSLRTQTIPTF